MPIDQFKISIVAKSVCLPSTTKYSALGSTPDRPVRVARPLGLVRPTLPRKNALFCSENFLGGEEERYITNEDDLRLLETDITGDMRRSWSGKSSVKITDSFNNANPGKESPRVLQRSKRQVFENRYKIAIARSESKEAKPKSANLYSKRVICLPMFRINLEKYTGGEDDKTVTSARKSLKEIMDNSKKQKPNSSKAKPATIKNYQFVSPGKNSNDGETTPRRLVISQPIKVPQANKQNGVVNGKTDLVSLKPGSVGGSSDTDRMDIRMDSLELTSVDDTNYSEMETDYLSPRQDSSIGNTIRRIKHVSDTANAQKYKLNPEFQERVTSAESEATWPSYDDIKRLRQNIRQQKTASRFSQMQGSRRMISPSARGTWEGNMGHGHTSSGKGRLNPIVVPTGAMCHQCSLYNNSGREPTPCPPNSPSLNESRGVTAVNVTFNKGMMWNDDDDDEDDDSEYLYHDLNDGQTRLQQNNLMPKSGGTSRSTPVRHSLEVLRMPKVTVKILESKEELQREASKLNYVKAVS